MAAARSSVLPASIAPSLFRADRGMGCSCSTVFRGDAPDFFEGRHSFNRLVDSGHAQRLHSFGHGLILDHRRRRAFDDETPDRFAHRQRFDDRQSSYIRMQRNVEAKSTPMSLRAATWLMRARSYSSGSSTVTTLYCRFFSS